MKFLRRVAGKTKQDRIRYQTIRKTWKVKPIQLHIEHAQVRWLVLKGIMVIREEKTKV